jgi:uncharacterized membrane protein YfcA
VTSHFLLFLIAGATAGGLVNGLAGFGTALFSLGFLLQIIPPPEAVAVVVVMSITSGVQGLIVVQEGIVANPGRLARFLIPAFVGVPFGAAILAVISAGTLKITIALFLMLYGAFFVARRSLPRFERPTPLIDCLIGLSGGVLGGAASLSGALPTMWCAMRPWTKIEQRAVLQPFNVAVLALTMTVLALKGTYTPHVLLLVVIAVPVAMIAAQIGIAIYRRLTDEQFRRLIIGLMFVSGVLLFAREALALA